MVTVSVLDWEEICCGNDACAWTSVRVCSGGSEAMSNWHKEDASTNVGACDAAVQPVKTPSAENEGPKCGATSALYLFVEMTRALMMFPFAVFECTT